MTEADRARVADKILPTHADVSYGPHRRNVLDLFLAQSDEPTPLVLYIHGGGFRGGDKSRLRQRDLQSFLQAGYTVASLNYRLTERLLHPRLTSIAVAPSSSCGIMRKKWHLDPS